MNRSRSIPFGSQDHVSPNPRVSYIDSNGAHYWRENAKRGREHRITAPVDKFLPLRFVVGAPALLGRGDPEVFITSQGPRIYFNRYELLDGAGCHTIACSDGLWFADPDLPGPP